MKFCGDYYDFYENEKNIISNASWEILNVFQQNFKV